ncbi:hypothetical protein KSF78_0008216 [Schistosoma japonicum]|nr:hypothetical protein KSF78_0008216 [Schistosoma japonicum]
MLTDIIEYHVGESNFDHRPHLFKVLYLTPEECLFLYFRIVGLLMGLVIILIKKLHTPSTRNYVVIFIAIIIMIPGIASLSLFDKWYYSVISEAVAFVTTVLAIITGMKLKIISVKWRKVLFAIACLFTITEIIFTIVGIIFKTDDRLRIVFQILSCATWCCTVFIVVSSTVWYLISHYDGIRYSMLFCAVCAWYEFALADINLQFVFIVSGCTKETNAFKL